MGGQKRGVRLETLWTEERPSWCRKERASVEKGLSCQNEHLTAVPYERCSEHNQATLRLETPNKKKKLCFHAPKHMLSDPYRGCCDSDPVTFPTPPPPTAVATAAITVFARPSLPRNHEHLTNVLTNEKRHHLSPPPRPPEKGTPGHTCLPCRGASSSRFSSAVCS